MKVNKTIQNSKTRKDISNPYHSYSHQTLLDLAKIEIFGGKVVIIEQPNGKISVSRQTEKSPKRIPRK